MTIRRRNLLAAAMGGLGVAGCSYPRFFELEWDEEVQLHDGRVIVVSVKNRYERLSQGLTPYGGAIISRDSTISFDAGGTAGKVSQLFLGFRPKLLDTYDGKWYVVLYGGHYGHSERIPGQHWGQNGATCGYAASIDQTSFVSIPINDLPPVFKANNMLLLYGEPSEHAKFSDRLVRLADKAAWVKKHPPGPKDASVCRP